MSVFLIWRERLTVFKLNETRLNEKLRMIEEKNMEFYYAEIEGLKQKDKVNEDKIKHLDDKLL